jgi:rhodanese-related sulfurtransferase
MIKTISISPKHQDFHISGVRHISPEDAFESVKNNTALLLDVRETIECNQERIASAEVMYIPLAEIIDSLDKLPHNKLIIVVCRAGIRSSKIANLLNYQGFPDAMNLDGGIIMWKSLGLPVESKTARSCGCGCSCGN